VWKLHHPIFNGNLRDWVLLTRTDAGLLLLQDTDEDLALPRQGFIVEKAGIPFCSMKDLNMLTPGTCETFEIVAE